MIKRMNKVTSLLVAAAAVISLAPISGVSAAERLETKQGTMNDVVAFDGGKYLFEGYKTENDANGVYFNSGDADKLLEDINATTIDKYGDKYAKIVDGSDQYLVDLSTGKVTEDTAQDIEDSVKTKLKASLSKTDRYGKINATTDITLTKTLVDQFGEVWYEYTAVGVNGTYKGYVNEAGKYIDTDVTANISVVKGTKTVKIEKFNTLDTDNNITVNFVSAQTIGQDKDNIYRVVNVSIVDADASTTTPATYIQKISKTQGTQEDKAYLPNTVSSYEVATSYDSSNADDAAGTLTGITSQNVRVKDGVIYVTKKSVDNRKVTVTTIKLKKDKVTLDGQTAKLDVYLAEQDVNKDQDIMGADAVSVDVDGNTWALNKGEILKFDGASFQVIYNVDRAMDTLEVYNASSLVAWQAGEDVYATVNKKVVETPVETPVTTTGWVKTNAGWTFFNASGNQVKGQWVNDGGVWYMIKADGIMATGWYNDNGTWYYLNGSGAMKTGWLNDNGTWYYLSGSGAMKTGWLNDNGTWYYLSGSGAMLANTVVDGYKLNASGAWVK